MDQVRDVLIHQVTLLFPEELDLIDFDKLLEFVEIFQMSEYHLASASIPLRSMLERLKGFLERFEMDINKVRESDEQPKVSVRVEPVHVVREMPDEDGEVLISFLRVLELDAGQFKHEHRVVPGVDSSEENLVLLGRDYFANILSASVDQLEDLEHEGKCLTTLRKICEAKTSFGNFFEYFAETFKVGEINFRKNKSFHFSEGQLAHVRQSLGG